MSNINPNRGTGRTTRQIISLVEKAAHKQGNYIYVVAPESAVRDFVTLIGEIASQIADISEINRMHSMIKLENGAQIFVMPVNRIVDHTRGFIIRDYEIDHYADEQSPAWEANEVLRMAIRGDLA